MVCTVVGECCAQAPLDLLVGSGLVHRNSRVPGHGHCVRERRQHDHCADQHHDEGHDQGRAAIAVVSGWLVRVIETGHHGTGGTHRTVCTHDTASLAATETVMLFHGDWPGTVADEKVRGWPFAVHAQLIGV
jgi:hypothetical protein